MLRGLFFVWLMSLCLLQAQVVSLSGYVRDAETGELVKGALVTDSAMAVSTVTNGSGYYTLNVSSGLHLITFTADGYVTSKLSAKIYRAVEHDVALMPLKTSKIDSMTEQYAARFDYRSSYYNGRQSLVSKYTGIGCVPDLQKFMQYLPGVQMGIDGMSTMYVRGSGAQENLTTMDGLPLYGIGRIFGFLSNYNTGLVRDFEFYRGVAPARYGGRSGGVLDVGYIDGSNKDFTGDLQVNLLCFDLKLNGFLDKNRKTVVALGLKRSWIDLFLQSNSNDNYVVANFHDINFKITHKYSRKTQLSAWIYNGRDNYGFAEAENKTDSLGRLQIDKFVINQKYQNTLVGLALAKTFNEVSQGKFTLGMSKFTHKQLLSLDRTIFSGTQSAHAKASLENTNGITDFIFNADFQQAMKNNMVLRYGLNSTLHSFVPMLETFKVEDSAKGNSINSYGKSNNHSAFETALYAETEYHTLKGMTINVGARAWLFGGLNKTFLKAEPRVLINQALGAKDGLKFAFGMANQGVHLLSSVAGELPKDGWVASSKAINPLTSTQVSLGYYTPLAWASLLSIDAFYKTVSGVLENNGLQQDQSINEYWVYTNEQGKSKARGIEVMVSKKYGKLSGLVSYTYSKINRVFTSGLIDNDFAFRWDRRHKLSGALVIEASKKMKYNLAVVAMSGSPTSVPTGVYRDAFNQVVYDFSERNNFRLPAYFRIDVGFERTISPYRYNMNSVAQYWGLHIYNITMHTNYYSAELSIKQLPNMTSERVVMGNYLFSFLPSAYYKLKF